MMKIYKVRQDIVLTKVCGEYLLIATKSALNYCPAVQHISKSAALLWEKMESGATIEELKETLKKNYRIPSGSVDIENDIRNLLEIMKETGYLLKN